MAVSSIILSFIINFVCIIRREVSMWQKLCPILLGFVNKICSIQWILIIIKKNIFMQKESTLLRAITLATWFLDWKEDWNFPFVVKNERKKIQKQYICHRDSCLKEIRLIAFVAVSESLIFLKFRRKNTVYGK